MAQQIKLKRSAVAGRVPTTSSLDLGEIAVNTADGKLYFQRGDSTIQSFFTTNALITGSLQQSGSDSYFLSNVGIGTATPSSKLHVSGGADVMLIEGSGSTANTSIFAIDGNNGRLFEVSDDLSDSLFSVNTIAGLPVVEVFSDNRVIMGAFNQNDLVISGSRVGIGTATPSAKLDVIGDVKITGSLDLSGSINVTGDQREINILGDDGQVALKLNDVNAGATDTGKIGWYINGTLYGSINATGGSPTDGLIIRSESSRAITFKTNGNFDRMIIQQDGNVGIGNNTPTEPLTVEGNISGSGNLTLNGNIYKAIESSYLGLYGGSDNTDNDGFIKIHGNANYWGRVQTNIGYSSASSKAYWTLANSTELMTLTGAGRLGIGATSPTEKLTVEGNISASGDLYLDGAIFDSSDTSGSLGQVLTSTAGGTAWEDIDTAVLDEVENIYATVKNVSGVTLLKGTPVHAVSGSSSGNVNPVIAASASDATTMPATFILNQDINDEAEGQAIIAGSITQVDTSAFEVGDIVYVGESGGYTNVKPTGSGNLIQNLGVVTKVHASNGSGIIYGSGRSNDIPNLPVGKVWVGSDNYSVTSSLIHFDESNERIALGSNVTTPNYGLDLQFSENSTRNVNIKNGFQGTGVYLENSLSNRQTTITLANNLANRLILVAGGSNSLHDVFGTDDVKDVGAISSDFDNGFKIGTKNDAPLSFYQNSSQVVDINSSGVFITGSLTVSGSSTFTNIGPAVLSGSLTVADEDSTVPVNIIRNDSNSTLPVKITNNNASGRSGLTFSLPNNNNQAYSIGVDNDRSFKIGENNLGTNTRFAITAAGNVGIGTTSPGKTLTVAGTFQASGEAFFSHFDNITSNSRMRDDLYINYGTARVFRIGYNSTTDKLQFGSGSNAIMTLDGSGNLDVSGSGNFTNNLTATGSLIVQHTTNSSRYLRLGWGSIYAHDANNELTLGSNRNDNTSTRIYISGKNADNTPSDAISMQANNGVAIYSGSSSDYFDPQALLHVSGAGIFTDGLTVTGSINHDGDLTVSGIVTAQEFHTEFVSASIVYQSGSTKFGDTADDTHSFTGSLDVSGSITAKGVVHTLANTPGTNGFQFQSNQIKPIINGYISLDRSNNRFFAFTDNAGSREYLRIDSSVSTDEANITFNEGQMYISSSGNIGIGTTAPNATLDVQGSKVYLGTGGSGSDRAFFIANTVTNTFEFNNSTGDRGVRITTNNGSVGGSSASRIYGAAGGILLEGANGQENIALTTDGKVGIGTTSPSEKLEVNGNVQVTSGSLTLDSPTPLVYLKDSTLDTTHIINSNNSELQIKGDQAIEMFANNTSSIYIASDGDVGIGTDTIASGVKLHVLGTTRPALFDSDSLVSVVKIVNSGTGNSTYNGLDLVTNSTSNSDIKSYGMPLVFSTSDTNGVQATERMRITGDGKVGIGTTSPQYPLHIMGGSNHLLAVRDTTTEVRIGIGTTNPGYALEIGGYSNRIIQGMTSLRFYDANDRITATGNGRIGLNASRGYFFYPTGSTPSYDNYGVEFRHLRDSAANTNDNILLVEQSDGTDVFNVKSSGNVGIGTTSPSEKLEVVGNTLLSGSLTVSGSIRVPDNIKIEIGDDRDLDLYHNGTNTVIANATGELIFGSPSYRFKNNTLSGDFLTITSAGKVGIGTTSPAYMLDVVGTGGTDGVIRSRRMIATGGTAADPAITTNSTIAGLYEPSYGRLGIVSRGQEVIRLVNNPQNDMLTLVGTTTGTARLQVKGFGNTSASASLLVENADSTTSLAVLDNGNVGIGTTTPETQLDITGDLTIGDRIYTRADGNRNTYIDSGTDRWTFYVANPILDLSLTEGAVFNEGGVSTMDFRVESDTNTHMLFVDAGNDRVGIGTTSPSDKLQVDGRVRIKSNSGLYIDTSDTYGAFAAANFEVINDASSNSVLRILNSGNGGYRNISINTYGGKLGIGTLNPTETLTVEGNISGSGNLVVEGSIEGASKSFNIPHPTQPGRKLIYGSLEGPEHGVYCRGQIEGNVIELPEEWTGLVDEDTITVQLTSIGSHQNLYVSDIKDNKVFIKNGNTFSSKIKAFYFIQAMRKDIDKLQTVR